MTLPTWIRQLEGFDCWSWRRAVSVPGFLGGDRHIKVPSWSA